MDEDRLQHRIRSLGEVAVSTDVVTGHLAELRAVRPRRAVGIGTVLGVAIALAGTAGGLALIGQAAAPIIPQAPPALVPPVQPDGLPTSDPCVGLPPFAGVAAEGDEVRAAEAELFAELRAAQCPDGDDAPAESASAANPCVGPPPFAGTIATDGRSRSAEALQVAAERAACREATATSEPAPPVSVPAGPPAGVPAGPPVSVPAGPPAGVPAGPPAGVPAGPPAGVPAGPPDADERRDTDGGRPADVPVGPPPGAGGGRGGG